MLRRVGGARRILLNTVDRFITQQISSNCGLFHAMDLFVVLFLMASLSRSRETVLLTWLPCRRIDEPLLLSKRTSKST